MSSPDLLFDGSASAALTVVLGHGAGATMDSPFMNAFAEGLAAQELRVARFEFPYMLRRRTEGRRPPPDRPVALEQRWRDVIAHLGDAGSLVIGGKSLGGRIASLVADAAGVGGLICLGYPFHPPDKPDRLRTAHLLALRTPGLILQGERDPFGTREEIPGFGLPDSIRVHYLADGDHSFKPRVRSGRTLQENLHEAVEIAAAFAAGPEWP